MTESTNVENTIARVMRWSIAGALLAFCIIFFWASPGSSMSIRLTTAMLCSGGGFVAGGLLSLIIVADDSH